MTLDLGMIDDSDFSWVNGQPVGQTDNAWNQLRTYHVPPAALHAGNNTLAIRVDDLGAGGGVHGEPRSSRSSRMARARPLCRAVAVPSRSGAAGRQRNKNQIATLLYNR